MLTRTFNQSLWIREQARAVIRQRLDDERGAALVEYALLFALIVLVCIGAVTFLGTATGDGVTRTADSVTAAN